MEENRGSLLSPLPKELQQYILMYFSSFLPAINAKRSHSPPKTHTINALAEPSPLTLSFSISVSVVQAVFPR